MKYKEQTLLKINRLSNMIIKVEGSVSRLEPQNIILHQIDELKQQLKSIKEGIDIENSQW